MGVKDRLSNPLDIARCLPGSQPPPAGHLSQADTRHIIHGEKRVAIEFAHLVDRHDIRMLQLRRRLSFNLKAFDVLLARQPLGADHLDGHDAVEGNLPGLIDDSHAAVGNFFKEHVIPETLSHFGFYPALRANFR